MGRLPHLSKYPYLFLSVKWAKKITDLQTWSAANSGLRPDGYLLSMAIFLCKTKIFWAGSHFKAHNILCQDR